MHDDINTGPPGGSIGNLQTRNSRIGLKSKYSHVTVSYLYGVSPVSFEVYRLGQLTEEVR
jgi:hypothetical protein